MQIRSKRQLMPAFISDQESARNGLSGMTLLEITVVILVLLSLISILFVGARAWKRGSDRALCIMHLQSVQKGVRSYANLYGFEVGDHAPDLQNKVIGLGRFVETVPTCPKGGTYSYGQTSGNETIPPLGELYMVCDLATSQDAHEPKYHAEW